MDSPTTFKEQRLFFNTGRRNVEGVDPIDGLELRPALLARYRDLTRLRGDFPLVLVDSGPSTGGLRSLASIVDETLREVAPRGLEGERLRKHVLRLEREVRRLVADGTRGRLSELWSRAAATLAVPEDPSSEAVLGHVAAKLKADGDVVDCDRAAPARIIAHLWQGAQERKAKTFLDVIGRLHVKLSDILRAAFIHSEAGQRADSLRASLGGAHREAFDFAAMSRLVGRNVPKDELPPSRRQRIEWALDVLGKQSFFVTATHGGQAAPGFGFRFDNCADAAEAFRTRLPQLAEIVKAIAIAELEVDGRYVEAEHDPFFERFDESSLSAEDFALFPDYLVCIALGRNDAPENAGLMDMLSAGLPVRVLVEAADLLEQAALGGQRFAFGVRSMRLANTATSLGGVFVVQTASSNLYALRGRLEEAFRHGGAALISVYGGAGASAALPPYLAAAAAMESRAFPAFTYNPYAGDNQAARFSLEDNPQPEADWPVHALQYADENVQQVSEQLPFTIADFMLCDSRYAAHFARVPHARWNAQMLPADEWLARDVKRLSDAVPYLLAVDANDVLQRVIVDAQAMRTVTHCRTFWHRLQEQGGIHNSHAEVLLAREQAKWEQSKAEEIRELKATAAPLKESAAREPAAAAPEDGAKSAASPVEVAAPARNPDEAWIETARCPSCNECQLINDRMFKYNDNKQAYIADINAGTFRQLVEAAEACQVSIIHPGKPRNPNEPGLDELVARAEPFQ
jgi:hypothetical protein